MDYILHIGIYFAIFSIAAMGLNLIVGYTGLFSVAHSVFYGIGAYATALVLNKLGAHFFLSVILGVVISMIVSFLIGFVLSRFSGDYFSIVSIGFCTIGYAIILNWEKLTGGGQGIFGIKRPTVFGHVILKNIEFLLLSAVFFVIVFFICRFIVKSSYGRVLKTIREDEKAIEVFGYNVRNYKLTIFVLGCMMASVAGSLFGTYIRFIDPAVSALTESVFMFVIIIFGGLGNLYGPLVGTIVIILIPEVLRYMGFPMNSAALIQEIMYGLSLAILMLFRPQGLIGEYKL